MPQEPSVGRIVHYYVAPPKEDFNGQTQGPYAAVITGVHQLGIVDLTVFSPDLSPVTVKKIAHDQGDGHPDFTCLPITRCWKWPPRT
jgi:hypothetical protein